MVPALGVVPPCAVATGVAGVLPPFGTDACADGVSAVGVV
jgi:hypothetical protein